VDGGRVPRTPALLPAAVRVPEADNIWGDTTYDLVLSDWRTVNGVKIAYQRSTFLGEWTRSGDKYVEDDDGYYVYCGRRDDMLKVSGMYVSPFEVEGVLQSHPDVLEAAVVGWPDVDALIKPKAFVVLKTQGLACADFAQRLQDECRQKLAVYKYPRWIEFRTELPKTATGKIQRFKLRAEADAK